MGEPETPEGKKFRELMESDLSGARLESYRKTRDIVETIMGENKHTPWTSNEARTSPAAIRLREAAAAWAANLRADLADPDDSVGLRRWEALAKAAADFAAAPQMLEALEMCLGLISALERPAVGRQEYDGDRAALATIRDAVTSAMAEAGH